MTTATATRKLTTSIRAFKRLNAIPMIPKPVAPVFSISVADKYDIMTIGKIEAKQLPIEDLEALIEYGRSYMKLYESGKFRTKKVVVVGRWGISVYGDMADLDEAWAYHEIKKNVEMLTNIRKS